MWYCVFADLIRRICRNVQHDHWWPSEELLEKLNCPLFLDLLRGKATKVANNEADAWKEPGYF